VVFAPFADRAQHFEPRTNAATAVCAASLFENESARRDHGPMLTWSLLRDTVEHDEFQLHMLNRSALKRQDVVMLAKPCGVPVPHELRIAPTGGANENLCTHGTVKRRTSGIKPRLLVEDCTRCIHEQQSNRGSQTQSWPNGFSSGNVLVAPIAKILGI
jgi:hypothetical protein